MTVLLAAGLSLLMIGTAFLSGIFGMAGGLILVGVLLFLFPLPTAMVLHAVTQMASNGWRTLLWWRHVRLATTGVYVVGCLLTLYVPDKAVALLLLGVSPFIVRAIPERILPRTMSAAHAAGSGIVCMALMLLTGVTGPLLDTLFLRSGWERRQIVATKASCQVFGHGFKLIYFGAVIDQGGSAEPWMLALAVVSSMIGTSLGKQILERLSDLQFLTWSNRIVTTIATYYIGYGLVLLAGVA
jgi:uncharacterized membrane protein YfcA